MQENPTTCPDCGADSPEEIIAVGPHRACVRCGWRSQDFDKISFPTDLFLDFIKDLQHFGPSGSPEYHKKLDLRVRVQQFRARWPKPAAAPKSESASTQPPREPVTVRIEEQNDETTPSPVISLPVPESQPENADDPNDAPNIRAIDHALKALTDQASIKDICDWIDRHEGVECPYAPQRSDRKWWTFYTNAKLEKREPLRVKIERRKRLYRERKRQIQ